MANKKLPRYEISIDPALSENDEKLGISQIAYVADPAIITLGMAFNNHIEKALCFADDLKYRLAAPALIPNMPIYRQDPEMGEYEVVFTKEVIEQLVSDFMLNKGKVAFNLDHNTALEAPSYILESWITGPSETDPSFTKYGIELPEGSFFVVSQFTDKEYFKTEILGKQRIGYSIEGFLGLSLETIKSQIKQNQMEKQTFEAKVGDVMPLADGEYKAKDGSIIVVKDEKIVEIKPADAPAEEPKAEEVKAADAPVKEEEPKKEEMAEPAPADAAPVAEAPVTEGQPATQEWVQSKLDELYKVIADLKTLIEADAAEDAAEDTSVEVQPAEMKSELKFRHLFR